MSSPALNAIGLMTRAEHEKLIDNSVTYHLRNYSALEAKFKTAITDLEKQAGEIAEKNGHIAHLEAEERSLILEAAGWKRAALGYELDALAMRRKRQMDRDRRKAS